MGTPETISFDKGINNRKAPLVLEDGELVTASGVDYEQIGAITNREARQVVNSTQYGGIKGFHRYINHVVMQEGYNYRYKWDLNGFCDLYTPTTEDFTLLGKLSNTNRPRFADYDEFIYMVNGADAKVFSQGNWYEWDIPGPASPASVATGAGGNPSGTYTCYVTFVIKFPSGRSYETSPSPSATVAPSSQKIEWTNIPLCHYGGDNLKIYRKLYRTSDDLIDTYLSTTIYDNTTTTYSDDNADATLLNNDTMDSETYISIPAGAVDIAEYRLRVFAIKGSYLYPSEPYLPFNFSNDTYLQVTNEGDDLVCVAPWGDQLYMASKGNWYRLQGVTPDTWQVRKTFAEQGIINRNTVVVTRFGILGLWYDGIYLFDGSVSRSVTTKKLQESMFTAIDHSVCYASWDGNRYYFHYASTGTTLDKRLVVDCRDYPDIRFYHDDFIPTAHFFDSNTGIDYYGYDGYQYEDGGTQTIALSVKTGDRAAKNILQQKQLEFLYYDIDTDDTDVTANIYADGTLAYTVTLNNSSRTRKRINLPSVHGYRFSLELICSDFQGVVIYSPWAISFNPFGV
jgi:hypothetical protein